MLGEGFAWIGGSYKPVKLDQCDGYSDNFDYLTIYLFLFFQGQEAEVQGPQDPAPGHPRRPPEEEAQVSPHIFLISPFFCDFFVFDLINKLRNFQICIIP